MKIKKENKARNAVRKVVEALQLPKDSTLGSMNMVMTDKYQIFIENYRSIIEYTDSSLKILGKNGRVHISGERLCIISYSADVMLVKGIFKEIVFV